MGLLTPAQLLARSSNIGAARIGIGLGRSGLYRALRRFGFGAPTGVALPGETGGILRHHRHWYDLDLASISFGQGLSVTTLQLAAAYAAIANGGRLVRPQIVRRIVDARGEIVEESAPEIVRQVVPRSTARLVADMLTAVTSAEGTGLEAAIDGYVVAGKTGTAQKADDDHGGYRRDAYTASFVGFVPAEAPRLVIAVVIDEPVIGHYGGMVAGPVFRRVGEAALRHLGVPPSGSGEALADIGRAVRTRSGTRRQAREQEEADPGFRADSAGPGPVEGGVRVPDLRGATARRAVLALTRAGLQPSLEGTGLVVAQAPEAGTIVPAASRVWVVLEAPSWQEPTLAADEADGEMSGDGDPGTHAVVGATAALAAAAPSRGGRR
jgi:cell division protein FtsI (penicillin-binding protein 3)